MKFILITLTVLFACNYTSAQESMLSDISYPFLEKLIETAKENYPKGKIYDKRVEFAEIGIKKAKLSYFEALSFSYLFNPANAAANPNQSILNGYRFGLVLNIGALLQKPSNVKQSQKEFEISQFEKGAFDLSLVAMVKERYFTYIQRLTILRLISNSLLDIESMLKESKYKFEKGEEPLENYNRILLMYSNQIQTKITIESDMLISKSSLEELLGKKLEEIQ